MSLYNGHSWCKIEDHKPIIERLRDIEFRDSSELARIQRLQTRNVARKVVADLRAKQQPKRYPCWACGKDPLLCGSGIICERKQGLD